MKPTMDKFAIRGSAGEDWDAVEAQRGLEYFGIEGVSESGAARVSFFAPSPLGVRFLFRN